MKAFVAAAFSLMIAVCSCANPQQPKPPAPRATVMPVATVPVSLNIDENGENEGVATHIILPSAHPHR